MQAEKTRTLARFNELESVVKVYDCFEENNTAYIVMELLRGKTVKEILTERKQQVYCKQKQEPPKCHLK